MSTLIEDLQSQFAQVLGAVLLPDNYTAPSLARVAGQALRPSRDEEVQAEVLRSAHMILEIERNEQALEERIAALRAKKQQAAKLADMLREDVATMLLESGVKSARDLDIVVSLRKNPDTLNVATDLEVLEMLHPEMVRVKKEINKAAINKHYKESGELIEGVELVQGGFSVQIKQ